MCGQLRGIKGTIVRPGAIFETLTATGLRHIRWGLEKGYARPYNARSESLVQKFGNEDHLIVPVKSFFEGGIEFKPTKDRAFHLAAVGNGEGFAIVTCPANAIVLPFHHRMPLILPDEASDDAWLQGYPKLAVYAWMEAA